MVLNLTRVAAGNRDIRTSRAASVVASDATGRLGRFRALADGALMSIALTADKVLCFDQVDEILDTRRFYLAVSDDEAAGEAAFLASWDSIHRRIAFEELWEHGTTFVYGSVNGDGLGPLGPYGTTCLVLDPESEGALALAVFPDNTALRFTDEDGSANAEDAIAGATGWSERGALAVIERATEVLAGDGDEWGHVLCRDDQFLEVNRAGPLGLGLLVEVRLPSGVHDQLEELWWTREMGSDMGVDEIAKADLYTALLRWEREHGAEIVGIA